MRRQVCRRIDARMRELALDGPGSYRDRLEQDPDEWSRLELLCRVTISRFGRDHGVFVALRDDVLPVLAASATSRGADRLLVWSAGCACGEEPYTVALIYELSLRERFPRIGISILGTDVDAVVLARARAARYPRSSLRELPREWVCRAFVDEDGEFRLRPALARTVQFETHDVREPPPAGPFDLVLCRNLAFTYFETDAHRWVASLLASALRPGGALVVGAHETVPVGPELEPWGTTRSVWRRV